MDKSHRCFMNQNHYAYTYAEMGIENGKASYNSACKQFFAVTNHLKKIDRHNFHTSAVNHPSLRENDKGNVCLL